MRALSSIRWLVDNDMGSPVALLASILRTLENLILEIYLDDRRDT